MKTSLMTLFIFSSSIMSGAHALTFDELPEQVSVIELTETTDLSVPPENLRPLGGAVINRKTQDRIELVCMEDYNDLAPCNRLRVRKNGKELIGSEMRVHTLPKNEIKEAMLQTTSDYYSDKKWRFRFIKNYASALTERETMLDVAKVSFIIAAVGGWGAMLEGMSTVHTLMIVGSIPSLWVVALVGGTSPILIKLSQNGWINIKAGIARKRTKRVFDFMLNSLEAGEHVSLSNKTFNVFYRSLMNVFGIPIPKKETR